MRSIFQSFKKQFYRAGDAYRAMVGTGSFVFEISGTKAAEGMNVQANTAMPNEEFTVRFVVNMRRFLDPSNPLYCANVWTSLLRQFGELLTDDQVQAMERSIAEWNQGAVWIEYNGRILTAEEIYRTLAEGEYFNQRIEVQDFLRELMKTPLLDHLLWFKFYNYNVQGYQMASKLFELISVVENAPEYKELSGDDNDTANRCIYCLSTDGSFGSEEHVVPEAMGNYDQVLPRGYVCDRCNNGVLANLDDELCHSPMFAWQIVSNVPHRKSGKLPEAQWNEAVLRRAGPRHIVLKVAPGFDPVEVLGQTADRTEIRTHLTSGRGIDLRDLARALAKIALGLVALDHGQEYACCARFDAARAFILNGKDFANNLLLGTLGTIRSDIRIVHQRLEPEGTFVAFNIFGVTLLLNLEQRPVLEINDQLREGAYIAFPLYGEPPEQEYNLRLINEDSAAGPTSGR